MTIYPFNRIHEYQFFIVLNHNYSLGTLGTEKSFQLIEEVEMSAYPVLLPS